MSTISTFDYDLPEEKIALYPLDKRDESQLLVYGNEHIERSHFKHLSQYIPEQSLLILNQTQVANARLELFKESGARIEVFCLEDIDEINPHIAFTKKGKATWTCLVGNAKKWKDSPLVVEKDGLFLKAYKGEGQDNGSFHIHFEWNEDQDFFTILDRIGAVPLPPYMKRKAEDKDKESYQTNVAEKVGSVAAPTASLHFTPEVLDRLKAKEVLFEKVTLHVGAGTFLPVKHENYEEHPMHYEYFELDLKSIIQLLKQHEQGLPIITSGTTSTRCIESLYWIAAKTTSTLDLPCKLDQFEYRNITPMEPIQALKQLIRVMEQQGLDKIYGQTGIMITPDYYPKLVDGLITNFHQPKSTLLLLIASFVGDQWQNIYDYALNNDFRFLSYGDSSLLWKRKQV